MLYVANAKVCLVRVASSLPTRVLTPSNVNPGPTLNPVVAPTRPYVYAEPAGLLKPLS